MSVNKVIFLVPVLLMLCAGGFAQDLSEPGPTDGSPVEGKPSFRLSDSDSGKLFFQRLSWEAAEFAFTYTVYLERKREALDTFIEVLRNEVPAANAFLDISVPPGEYRFRVQSKNILGMLDSETEWDYFSIIEALYPNIVDFQPSAFYFDRPGARILTLSGENLLPEAEIFLVNLVLTDESGEQLILRPSEIVRNQLGENARLVFNEEDLLAGKYEIVVINPGGLEIRTGGFVIAMAKPFDVNVAIGYSPAIALFGRTDFFLDRVFIPLSFSARASYVPFKLSFGYIGFELTADWSFLTSERDQKKTQAHLVTVNANALFQYWLYKKKLALNSRAGVGITGIFNHHFIYTDTGKKSPDSYNTMAFSLSLGASVQWLFFRQLFIEGGADLVFITHPEIPMGLVRIGVYVGYQF